MDELMREKTDRQEKDDSIILFRDGEKQYVLSHAGSERKVDEHTASKLMLLESLGETGKSYRLASRLIGGDAKEFRLDTVLLAEMAERKGKDNPFDKEMGLEKNRSKTNSVNGQESGKRESRATVLDAHVTGIGAAGDFHLTARVQDSKSGEVREEKGMITGMDAALLRSDTNEQGKDGTVLSNAQAIACENFEKGMSAAFARNNAVTMKME